LLCGGLSTGILLMSHKQAHDSQADNHRRTMPRWKKLLVAAAVVVAAIGGGFAGYNALTAPDQKVAASQATTQPSEPAGEDSGIRPRSFAPSDDSGWDWPTLPTLPGEGGGERPTFPESDEQPGSTGQPESAADVESEPIWPGAVFRLGFGFVVGFCIGYAARMFLRIATVLVGLMLLGLFGLQYSGLISVDWTAMESAFHAILGWLGTNTASFRQFITGQLPSAASALGGLVVGFKK
jgi:uncharacterized membrane protein (Fun14 family)